MKWVRRVGLGWGWSCLMCIVAAGAEQGKFPCAEDGIARYTAYRTGETMRIDGKLDEAIWGRAPRSPRFVDILTGGRTIHDTRATVVWDESNLYVGYWVEEPLVRAKFTKKNDPIYYDNDVEFF